MPELAVIVPTRGRPENIWKVIGAWDFTNAWNVADLVLVADSDDPKIQGYRDVVAEIENPDTGEPLIRLIEMAVWMPMVHKLNMVAKDLAEEPYWALAFAGDDHLPQTINWAKRYLTVLHELGTGMVYGDDGYQGRKLSTEWAVTADVVRALGRMVPAPVDHMYCDNSMMDLFNEAGALRHLPEIRIEHRHPIAGKAETDSQYQRVNSREQFRADRLAYERWKRSGLAEDVAAVRALRPGAPEFKVEPVRPSVPPVMMRPIRGVPRPRSGPTRERVNMNRFPFTREFKEVRGATPDEIGMVLADFATQVPADQEIVELGVFQGRTALIMAWGAAQGHGAHLTAIDPWDLEGNVYDPPFTDEESKSWAIYRVRELGYADRISLVQAFSHEIAADWVTSSDLIGRGNKPVGLLFVDGDHTHEGARRDIESWAPHLAAGAVIAVDDYGHPDWPGVAEAVDELVDEGFLEPVTIYHERLAVTRLAEVTPAEEKSYQRADLLHREIEHTTTSEGAGERSQRGLGAPKTITSEGVSPSPEEVYQEGVANGLSDHEAREDAWPADEVDSLFPDASPEIDTEESSHHPSIDRERGVVHAGELGDVPAGTPIGELNVGQLRTLAKQRGIRLGVRKDKRDAILTALGEGA